MPKVNFMFHVDAAYADNGHRNDTNFAQAQYGSHLAEEREDMGSFCINDFVEL